MSLVIRLIASASLCLPAICAFGQDTDSESDTEATGEAGVFASDEGGLDGDHLKLRVTVPGFEVVGGGVKKFCAPKGSKLKITKQTDTHVHVIFKTVPVLSQAKAQNSVASTGEAATTGAIQACGADLVNDYTQYRIATAKLSDYSFRRTGVMFGALIVPFKFYLGNESRLSASSTIAPYIGFRGPAPFGLTFTPIVSAGLGLVPVTDADTSETATKSALSTAVGVLLTHSKNEKFNAGLLVGKDFLSRSDRGNDQAVGDLWFSIYAGYAL